jgi:hypothetical protein
MIAHTFQRDDRVYVSHPAPWGGRLGTVAGDEVDSLGRVRVLLDGDDDGTGRNWVAIEAEYLVLSFDVEDVEDVLGDTDDVERVSSAVAPLRRVSMFHAAVGVALALVVGVASGMAVMGRPTIQAPQDCTVMANIAERAFVSYENLAYSTQLAATRGRSEFAGHEEDKATARGEIDDLGPLYHDAKAECLGVDR